MKTHAFIPGVVAFLAATVLSPLLQPLQAEIIGVEQFDYSDGAIAGQTGGTFWDWQNRLTPAPGPRHTGTPSNWNGTPSVASGRLVTSNSSARREYNGLGEGPSIETDEGFGAINNFSGNGISFQQHAVYYRVTFSTGANLPSFVSINSSDFGTDRVGFGASLDLPNDNKFSIKEFSTNSITNSGTILAANTTYTLVAKLDFVSGMATLYLNPNLNAAENLQTILRGPFPFNTANWSTSVRLSSGTGGSVAWDDLVVATTWDELGTVVTTTADEDDSSLLPTTNTGSGGTGVSLREAVKYSPSGTLITFDPALNGQTCTLSTSNEIVVTKNLTLDASSLSAGLTIDGGAGTNRIFTVNSGQSLTLRSLTLTGGNGAGAMKTGNGGAIFNNDGTLTLRECTLSGNSAAYGGAIFFNFGSLTLTQCTFSGNSAQSFGGAIYNGDTLKLTQCTLSGNSALDVGGAIFNESTLTLTHSIVAGNRAINGPDVSVASGATVTATGVNLLGNLAGSGLSAGPTVLVGDAKLSPLGYFGGPTMTMHPLIGSPAIDAGGTTDPGGTDQRGFPRFVDGDTASSGAQLDIGAVEAGPLRTVAFNSDNVGSSGSLRARIELSTEPGARIAFLPGVNFPGTITLNGTELTIPSTANGLFIDASNLSGPVTISGNPTTPSRVFNIAAGATVAMHSLVIQNGKAPDAPDDSTRTPGGNGGGIINGGSLSLFSSVVQNSRAGNGVPNTSFVGPSSDGGHGGGIYSVGRLHLAKSTVANNVSGTGGNNNNISGSAGNGGGIYSEGPLELIYSTLSNNVTGGGGSGPVGSSGGRGGAIHKADFISYQLTACTLGGNLTGRGGSGTQSNGSLGTGAGISGGNAVLQHCIITQNGTVTGISDNVNVASLTLLLSNLLGTSAFESTTTGPAPIFADDAFLEPIANNGGPTQTMALRVGSPAIDAATGSTATSDQRDFPIVGVADLGAFELQPPPPPPPAPVTRLIQVRSNSIRNGTVSGGGNIILNARVTVRARPKKGRKFDRWLEGGKTVSRSAAYTFTVTRNRVLVARFR